MSFSLKATYASRVAAQAALGVNPETGAFDVGLPGPVRKYLLEALNAVQDGEAVEVEAYGHLATPETLRTSDCRLLVTPIPGAVSRPKTVASADPVETEFRTDAAIEADRAEAQKAERTVDEMASALQEEHGLSDSPA